MYNLIEANRGIVLRAIPREHVEGYDWLVEHFHACDVRTDTTFQQRYVRYWGLSSRYVASGWLKRYFDELEKAKRIAPTPGALCTLLYPIPATPKGKLVLHYSFCSKIVHMVAPNEPILDSRVEAFFFLTRPALTAAIDNKIRRYDDYLVFLRVEYHRVICSGLLALSMDDFKKHFAPCHFTDEKIIDSLIWGWGKACTRGAITKGTVKYA